MGVRQGGNDTPVNSVCVWMGGGGCLGKSEVLGWLECPWPYPGQALPRFQWQTWAIQELPLIHHSWPLENHPLSGSQEWPDSVNTGPCHRSHLSNPWTLSGQAIVGWVGWADSSSGSIWSTWPPRSHGHPANVWVPYCKPGLIPDTGHTAVNKTELLLSSRQ